MTEALHLPLNPVIGVIDGPEGGMHTYPVLADDRVGEGGTVGQASIQESEGKVIRATNGLPIQPGDTVTREGTTITVHPK